MKIPDMSEILFSVENHIATLTMNRPDKYNAITREFALQFIDKMRICKEDENIRVVIITGAGRAFCAGQDLGEIISSSGLDISKIVKEHINPMVTGIRTLEKPVIAAVNGVAAGAGANLALACDIVIAADSATFLQAFSAIGLIPDTAGTYILPRLIGWQKASALMMLGEKITATEAERIGMIYKQTPREIFKETIAMAAGRLASLPPIGLALTKRALNQSFHNTFEQQLRVEDQLQSIAGNTEDYKEGVQAFVEKRKPVFKGK